MVIADEGQDAITDKGIIKHVKANTYLKVKLKKEKWTFLVCIFL